MSYLIKTIQPTSEPVTLAQMQLHLRLDTEGVPPSHPDDELITGLISAAREIVENYTAFTLVETTYQCKEIMKNAFVSLKTFPVLTIESVTYQDADDVTQTIDSSEYYIDNFKRPSLLRFKGDTLDREITVTFTAGFTDGDEPNFFPMPQPLYSAIKLIVSDLYTNRESESENKRYTVPQSSEKLMNQYRIDMGT